MTTEEKRIEAHKRAHEAYGTTQIFRRRADFYRAAQRLLTFLGIAVPVLVGGSVLSFSNSQGLLPILLPVAGILIVAQLVVSVWSLVNKWDDAYEYSLRSQDRNSDLEFKWNRLPKLPEPEMDAAFESLSLQTFQQSKEDEKHSVSQKERRRAMRATLFKFQTPCAICKLVPRSLKSSACACCGNF